MQRRNRMMILVTATISPRPALLHDTALKESCEREIDAGDLDDGLPSDLLAGAIVKMWVAHRLDWAGELLGRRGEERAYFMKR
jgi:hypothetical protein